MKITTTEPKNWRDLQDEVCRYLNEAGYIAETPKTIETVRGQVEVDVYAESNKELIKSFICECKYWNSPLPKEKIHAFRTVTHDSGSMLGIIISKNGFQSGAYEAAYCSNILLKDWNGFIDLIKRQWLTNQMTKLVEISGPLSVYTDSMDVPYIELEEHKKKLYMEVTEKCISAYLLLRTFNRKNFYEESITVNEVTFYAMDELFKYLKKIFIESIEQYEKIFENNPVEQWKLEFNDPISKINIIDFFEETI